MYLSKITIENFRCFGDGDRALEVPLRQGLTALVGENDTGKTAVIDAIRLALGTTDQDWFRLKDTDFHVGDRSRQIKITCQFDGLCKVELGAFAEYLTYGDNAGEDPFLVINWLAKDTGEVRKGRSYRRVEVYSGRDGGGPRLEPEVRELLRATYLRPLRDAEQALSAGRGSRLAQVLRHSNRIKTGVDRCDPEAPLQGQKLSVLGIGNLTNALLNEQQAVVGTRKEINKHLLGLSLSGDKIESTINVSGAMASDDGRLRELLEKLDLRVAGDGQPGLGSNNLLFMACELLLLAQETEGNNLLLIEEPEAHLHAQRQLRAMKFLQEQALQRSIQVIVTTHSPNLASAIDLNNIVMLSDGNAYSMAEGDTLLEPSDYRFLQRFLDVTKANLFFARGVLIVEGDAENILLPTLARLLGRDFTEHGVSIVNVGGIGLRRYARIFQRRCIREEDEDRHLMVPVACVTDLDVMPDCAPAIIGLLTDNDEWPPLDGRRWRARRDIGNADDLDKHRSEKIAKPSGQCVKTFVSDQWTLEYDLAFSGLAEDVYVAARLAKRDEALARNGNAFGEADVAATIKNAESDFETLRTESYAAVNGNTDCEAEEVIAAEVYAEFTRGKKASKAIAAQYLAERLRLQFETHESTPADWEACLPAYLVHAIKYLTSGVEGEGVHAVAGSPDNE